MLQYLSTYHVIFIVDDSTSMILNDDYSAWDENRWNQAQRAIGPIAQFAFDKNVTNIDMGFMHYQRNSPIRGLQSANAVVQAFDRAKPPRNLNPYQNTPTGVVLDFHITKALDELDLKARTDLNAYKQIPPTDIILLTDGEADDDPKAVMQRAGKRLDAGKHNHNYIGIQIVQIGNSPRVAEKLADITKGEYGVCSRSPKARILLIFPENLGYGRSRSFERARSYV
ncbi:hypothetical protein BKA70DRAFT_506547 [Coprinopsis sp. MPI-PUGE-AT-0042]|nr:hypothetical protein BKA70DRAFT_506547 [Coprinopsis sp. MPI-PUGE-AT-0042]